MGRDDVLAWLHKCNCGHVIGGCARLSRNAPARGGVAKLKQCADLPTGVMRRDRGTSIALPSDSP
jgi:hypothetical protein